MSEYLALFLNNLLPVFLIASSGFLIGKYLQVNPRSLSQVIFYIFSPCLIFKLITDNQLGDGDILRMMGFTVLITTVIGLITLGLGLALKLQRGLLAAVMLTAMFNNSGNLGLSINLFAFGETALAHASLFFVTMAMLNYTVGVVIASMGSSGFLKSMSGLLRLPILYALGLAFIFVRFRWELPLPLDRTVTLLGNAAVPCMLVLLGLQLYKVQWNGNTRALSLTNAMRLLAAPLLALAFSQVFGLEGPARQAGVLEAAMPTAVLTTVIATEYDVEPAFVTTAVFVSTLLSPFTLTPLMAYLGN